MHARRALVGGDLIVNRTANDFRQTSVPTVFGKRIRQAYSREQRGYNIRDVSRTGAHSTLGHSLEENHIPNVVSVQLPFIASAPAQGLTGQAKPGNSEGAGTVRMVYNPVSTGSRL